MEEANWELEEWTVEANPEDLDDGTLDAMKAAGIDRLSIGVQSFQPDVLAWMNRRPWRRGLACRWRQRKTPWNAQRRRGFDHLSLDLIYGVPVGGAHRWKEDMDTACALPVDHLSCLHPDRRAQDGVRPPAEKGDVSAPPMDGSSTNTNGCSATTRRAGFEHYEVSNFARPGGHSQHNSAYWDAEPPTSASDRERTATSVHQRWWNARSNARYLKAAEAGNF